jgi:cytochrome c oxidase assembly protein subunit 15
LQPVIVTIHLLLGVTLLALLTWFGARQSDHPSVSQSAAALRIPAALAIVLLVIQIALGGWVSSNYAALACPDFPLCQGALLPQMDFVNGFSLWRDLGKTAHGDYLPFPALTAIHWTHRAFALVVVILVAWVALRAFKIDALRKTARWLLIMIVLQFAIGISNVFLKLPLALAVAHNGGAALLLILLVMLNHKIRFTQH